MAGISESPQAMAGRPGPKRHAPRSGHVLLHARAECPRRDGSRAERVSVTSARRTAWRPGGSRSGVLDVAGGCGLLLVARASERGLELADAGADGTSGLGQALRAEDEQGYDEHDDELQWDRYRPWRSP